MEALLDTRKLTYFQPRTVLQHTQWMSATVCRPVMSTRSSLGPSTTFTLQRTHARRTAIETRTQRTAGQALHLVGNAAGSLAEHVCERRFLPNVPADGRHAQQKARGTGAREESESAPSTHTFPNKYALPCLPWKACNAHGRGLVNLGRCRCT